MENEKICPVCKAQYYAHVSRCCDCDVDLVDQLPEDGPARDLDPEKTMAIATGTVANLKKLIALIEEARIPHRVRPIDGESTLELTPGTLFGIFIDPEDAETVAEIVRSQTLAEYPEIEKAREQLEAGICPACGFEAGEEQTCPECGLPLIIEEEGEGAPDEGEPG
ncbi:MAG: hypothetical protein GXO91_07895 [FCB group bacterium]|nr:hypothetical protein [FCB group bacterium]